MSERAIELPWFGGHLADSRMILDIGWTFSPPEWFSVLFACVDAGASVTGIDIIEPKRVVNRYLAEQRDRILATPVIVDDVLNVTLPPKHYDTVTCLSTLEHIGIDRASPSKDSGSVFDRSLHAEDVELARDPSVDERFLNAMAHTIAKGGRLLLSVPLGEGRTILHQDSLGLFTTQYEYSAADWRRLLAHPAFEVQADDTWVYSPAGWMPTTSVEAASEGTSELLPYATAVGLAVLERR